MNLTKAHQRILSAFGDREFTSDDAALRISMQPEVSRQTCGQLATWGFLSRSKADGVLIYRKIKDYIPKLDIDQAVVSKKPKAEKISCDEIKTEADYGKALRKLAKKEGHRRGLPRNLSPECNPYNHYLTDIVQSVADKGEDFSSGKYAVEKNHCKAYASRLVQKTAKAGYIKRVGEKFTGNRGRHPIYEVTSAGRKYLEAAQ